MKVTVNKISSLKQGAIAINAWIRDINAQQEENRVPPSILKAMTGLLMFCEDLGKVEVNVKA